MKNKGTSIESWMEKIEEKNVEYTVFVEIGQTSLKEMETIISEMMKINDKGDSKVRMKIVDGTKETGSTYAAVYQSDCGRYIAFKDSEKET